MTSIPSEQWVVGVDASNIRGGGGVTHLAELLRAADPACHHIRKVVVWSGRKTLAALEARSWLTKDHHPWLDGSLVYRVLWQRFILPRQARRAGCDLMFVPGGTAMSGFRPMVTMSQNLLPFEWREVQRYGFSWMALKWSLLRLTQTCTFRKADGVIFLTRFARDRVLSLIGPLACSDVVVPHGVRDSFVNPPREQHPLDHYSVARPFRLLYVSVVDFYKHQWHVVEAVSLLRRKGVPVALDLVGPAYSPALKRLKKAISNFDPAGDWVQYEGFVPYAEMYSRYATADLAVFASSCETFGQILTEAMSAGLPVACAECSAMPELLGDAGVYFDPESPADIAAAVMKLIESPGLRAEKAGAAFERVRQYSWERCASETFVFLQKAASRSGESPRGGVGVQAMPFGKERE